MLIERTFEDLGIPLNRSGDPFVSSGLPAVEKRNPHTLHSASNATESDILLSPFLRSSKTIGNSLHLNPSLWARYFISI